MMTKEEVAKKLAEITGKSIEGFLNGTIREDKEPTRSNIHNINDECNIEFRNNKTPVCTISRGESSWSTDSSASSSECSNKEVLEFQKLFKGSKIVNNKILYGRQMTRKEYNKFTKNLTYEEYFNHPLMYKIFRAEGQTEVNFMSFSERFPRTEYEEQK